MPQKKIKPETPNSIALLIVSKDDFKRDIAKRITQGEELFNRAIGNIDELNKLKSDYTIWSEYNFEYLKQSFNIPDNQYSNSYNHAGFSFMGQMGEVASNPIQTRKNLINYKLEELKSLLNRADLLRSDIQYTNSSNNRIDTDEKPKPEVFIVHGHDDLAKVKVARFIEALGFKPIILHEQASSGKTIIEKIEEYSNVGFGIVLYTQCDIGSKKGEENNLHFRARQNVVFEHGYLIGKIGRSNVCALVKNEVETPNDISGVVYVKMDQEDAWHLKIAKELRNSGYVVDMNKL